jgi:hypothetical protein
MANHLEHDMPKGMETISRLNFVPNFYLIEKEFHIQISCYENRIPDFVESELMRLYGSSFSSLKRLHVWGEDKDVNTYVVKENGVVKTILLFRIEQDKVYVLNQVFTLEEPEADRFSQYVFATYLFVKVILFKAVHTDLEKLSFPFHRYNLSENIVASLPSSSEEYWSSLGKSTRQNISRYRNKLSREMPPYVFKVYENEEIQEEHFRRLIDLSRARLNEKNKVLGWSEEEIEKLIRLAKLSGLMGVIILDGSISAGVVCYKAGHNYCLEVIAHDPALNEYRLGRLCCFLTISACIERGAKEFHFLWGAYEYKYHFLGVQRNLDRIVVYRSALQRILHGRLALESASQDIVRKMKLWIHSDDAMHNPMGRMAIHCIKGLKGMRSSRSLQRQQAQ